VKNNKRQILELLEKGKITADEAIQLLGALENETQTTEKQAPQEAEQEEEIFEGKGPAKYLKVNIFSRDGEKVNMKFPVRLIKMSFKLFGSFPLKIYSPDNLEMDKVDVDKVMEAINSGIRGKIIEVADKEDKIEIVLD
jgi:hypothetical protein